MFTWLPLMMYLMATNFVLTSLTGSLECDPGLRCIISCFFFPTYFLVSLACEEGDPSDSIAWSRGYKTLFMPN